MKEREGSMLSVYRSCNKIRYSITMAYFSDDCAVRMACALKQWKFVIKSVDRTGTLDWYLPVLDIYIERGLFHSCLFQT